MLQNLTPRERILVLATGGLLPVLLLFWAFTSFTGKYFSNNRQISGVKNQIVQQEDLQIAAQMAQQRRFFYRDHGLPADDDLARIQYEAWLNHVLRKEAGLKVDSLEPGTTTPVRFRKGNTISEVCRQFSWTFVAKGNLEQVTKMLRGFRSLDMMHRLNSISIKPQTVGGSGSDKSNRTGELRIEAEVQVLSMVDAELQREFREDILPESDEVKSLVDSVLVRNIFGPANNPPNITSSSSKSSETETDISFDISASDPDGDSDLKFELLESNIEGAKLVPSESAGRVMFEAPPLAAEKYTFKVRVTDGGFPPKSTEKDFSLTVREKIVKVEDPKPPEFKHAKATKLTAIVRGVDGRLECWVMVQTINQQHRPTVGESFELDEMTWTVRAISKENNTAVFEVNNQLLTVKMGSTLDKPESTESLTTENSSDGD